METFTGSMIQSLRTELFQLSMGSYLSSRNCDSNLDSDQPLSAERDFFSFHFTGMNMELIVNNFFYDYSDPERAAKQPFLVSRIKF